MTSRQLRFDERMSKGLHIQLVNHLMRLFERDCPPELFTLDVVLSACHGIDKTETFLREHHVNVPDAIEWLAEFGGHCDCEVVLNTHPRLREQTPDGPVVLH